MQINFVSVFSKFIYYKRHIKKSSNCMFSRFSVASDFSNQLNPIRRLRTHFGPHMSAIHWTSLTQRAETMSPGLSGPIATTRLLSTARAAAMDVLAALQIPVSDDLPGLPSPAGRSVNCSPCTSINLVSWVVDGLTLSFISFLMAASSATSKVQPLVLTYPLPELEGRTMAPPNMIPAVSSCTK